MVSEFLLPFCWAAVRPEFSPDGSQDAILSEFSLDVITVVWSSVLAGTALDEMLRWLRDVLSRSGQVRSLVVGFLVERHPGSSAPLAVEETFWASAFQASLREVEDGRRWHRVSRGGLGPTW